MRGGRFEPATLIFVNINGNGKKVLIDGQHALSAIVQSGRPQKMILIEDEVSSEDEIPYKFARYDVQKRRNLGDSIFAFDLPNTLPFNRSYIRKVSSAIRFIESGFGMRGYDESAIEDDIKAIKDWSDCANQFFEIYESEKGVKSIKQRFLNRSVLSVALVTLRYVDDRDRVPGFWNGFIHGSNLASDDPALVGRNKYLSISVRGGAPNVYKEKWAPNAISRLVAWAWNMHYLGEKRTIARIGNIDKRVPVEIKGTKYFK